MKINWRLFIFLPIAVFLAAQSFIASGEDLFSVDWILNADEVWDTNVPAIPTEAIDSFGVSFTLPNEATICHADEIWTTNIETIPDEATDAGDAGFLLPDEAVVSHADEIWTMGVEPVADEAIDANAASFNLPNEAVICHADEVWTSGLASVEIGEETIESEIISGRQEWVADKTIGKPVVISAGAQLTIKKGVKLNFVSGGSIAVNGELIAKGTVKNPIIAKAASGYSGTMISVVASGNAEFRNVKFNSVLTDDLPALHTAMAIDGAGKLAMQGSEIYGAAIGIKLNQINSQNIQVNRTKFANNVVDAQNANPADNNLPDFRWDWWSDPKITGDIDSSNRIEGQMRDPVIIAPGIVGSWQKDGQWEIDPIFHSFDGLIAQLKAAGYVENVDLFEFPYNWRDSNANSALYLAGLIEKIKADTKMPKVDIVAHSMGGLLAREYIESDYYHDDVDQLITIATPNNGSPQSYLLWEGGDLKPGLFESLGKNVLVQEAKENHYSDLLSYVRNRVPSVSQLLPIYSYLYEGNTGILRQYPFNYPQNLFLENLNFTENVNKLGTLEYDKIIADLDSDQSTISGFKVETSTQLPKWQHGYPLGYDIPIGSRGLVKGDGDGTVPLVSARSENISEDETIAIASDHNGAMTVGRQDVLELLIGTRPQGVNVEWQVPNLLLVQVFSPVDIQIIAPDGKWIGKNISNLPEADRITDAYYTGFDAEAEFVTIPNPSGEYKIITQGTGAGDYTVEATVISQDSESGQAKEEKIVVQGTAIAGEVEQAAVEVGGEGTVTLKDITPPTIAVGSPINGNLYLNSKILPITYAATDDQSAAEKIAAHISLDGATTTVAAIDLAFQKTGGHILKIIARDEAGNASSTETRFSVFATIDSIAVNAAKFAGLGLIKKPQNIILAAQLKALQAQFGILDKLKANPKTAAKAKMAAVKALGLVINKQIDLLVKEIQKTSGKGIGIQIAELLIDSLKYIKIK